MQAMTRGAGSPLAVVMVMGAILFGGCVDDSGLDGPESFEFDSVNGLDIEISRGDVTVFATERVDGGSVVDRWSTDGEGFDVRHESVDDGQLRIESACRSGQDCEVRYEITVDPRTPMNLSVGQGQIQIVRAEATVDAHVEEGDLSARNMYSRVASLRADAGTMDIQYPQMPGKLELTLGDSSQANVAIPAGPYRCYFDDRAESVAIGDLECTSGVSEAIVVDPPDSTVYFEVEGQAR